MMFRPSVLLASLAAFCVVNLEAKPKPVAELADPTSFQAATAVVRARILAPPGECDKYCTAPVETIRVLKAPQGVTFPPKFDIAFLSFGPHPPVGVSTLYLVRYNPQKPELGWSLLSKSSRDDKAVGFSHHEPE